MSDKHTRHLPVREREKGEVRCSGIMVLMMVMVMVVRRLRQWQGLQITNR